MLEAFTNKLSQIRNSLGNTADRWHDRAKGQREADRFTFPNSIPEDVRASMVAQEERKTPEQVQRDNDLYTPLYNKLLVQLLKGFDNPETTYKDHNFK